MANNKNRKEIALLSIFSSHAESIYSGHKKAELRKSFSTKASPIIFLYETAPIKAITGFIIVKKATKKTVEEIAKEAEPLGVPKQRTLKYYADRKSGWIIEIGYASRLDSPIGIDKLRSITHYFSVPQVYAFLPRYEELAYFLMQKALPKLKAAMHFEEFKESDHRLQHFAELIYDTVGQHYDDIDGDFITQLTTNEARSNYSTETKTIYEIHLGGILLGYTVTTQKQSKSLKFGPTVLEPEFRGIGLGPLVRFYMEGLLVEKGIRKIYCTCPQNNNGIVGYLLDSGMELEAVLCNHLSEDRNELVFGKFLYPPKKIVRTRTSKGASDNPKLIVGVGMKPRHLQFIVDTSADCYFKQGKTKAKSFYNNLVKEKSLDEVPYSKKQRKCYYADYGNHSPAMLILATLKRSNMLKLNLYTRIDSYHIARTLVARVLKQERTRRIYLTFPVSMEQICLALVQHGFQIEGQIRQPFGKDDHFCFGLVRD